MDDFAFNNDKWKEISMQIIEVPAIITHVSPGYGTAIYEVEGGVFHAQEFVTIDGHTLAPGDEVLLHFGAWPLKSSDHSLLTGKKCRLR